MRHQTKQMEKFLKYLMLLLVATFSLTFASCNGDDDDEPKNPANNQSPDKFHPSEWVGIWEQNVAEYHPEMLLCADGKAIIHTVSQDGKYNTPYDFTWYDHYTLTEWTYDPERKYLSVGRWIFEVTMKTPASWSGIFTKGSKQYNQYFILNNDEATIAEWWNKANS